MGELATEGEMPCGLASIMEHLIRGGLDAWIVPCYTLLIHFHGLETAIEVPTEEPEPAIAESVKAAIREKPHRREAALRVRLCNLPLFQHRASSNEETWCPLEEPLMCFQHRHEMRGEECRFWRDRQGRSNPTSDHIETWLNRVVTLHGSKSPVALYPIR